MKLGVAMSTVATDVSNPNVSVASTAKPKAPKASEGKVHSITFYIPRKKISFYSETLKTLANINHGTETATGKVSQYIRALIDRDFKDRGLINERGEPKLEVLEDLKTKLSAS